MCDSKVLHLKFVGMDSWDRPVYEDEIGTLCNLTYRLENRSMNKCLLARRQMKSIVLQ